jgi:hypothetical protein
MHKLTKEQAGLLEQILEAGIKAVTGENVPINICLPIREPEYEYVTDGEARRLAPGDWWYDSTANKFTVCSVYTNGTFMPYRRVEKKP